MVFGICKLRDIIYIKLEFFLPRWLFGFLKKVYNLANTQTTKANCTLPHLSKVNIFPVVYSVTLGLLLRCAEIVYKIRSQETQNPLDSNRCCHNYKKIKIIHC